MLDILAMSMMDASRMSSFAHIPENPDWRIDEAKRLSRHKLHQRAETACPSAGVNDPRVV